jgi:hypothetical protein
LVKKPQGILGVNVPTLNNKMIFEHSYRSLGISLGLGVSHSDVPKSTNHIFEWISSIQRLEISAKFGPLWSDDFVTGIKNFQCGPK